MTRTLSQLIVMPMSESLIWSAHLDLALQHTV